MSIHVAVKGAAVCALACMAACASETVASVDTSEGVVIGRAANGVARFLGIPYAEPPIGALRWRPPVRRAAASTSRSATQVGPACPQLQPDGSIEGDEDCLYLNVWAPQGGAGRHPVMVFIHGGAFAIGSGGDPLYDGSYLADKGQVVVVTINYRLAQLGFLAHPALVAEDEHHSAGNYGLLDQQMALRWVQRSIAAFGGDPGNVTIFGESAGGLSVCAHLASPLAAGLFQRALAESGACMLMSTPLHDTPGQPHESAEALGLRFAAALGCDGASDVAACMRDQPVARVLAAAPADPAIVPPHVQYVPNLDGWVLPTNMVETFRVGQIAAVPFLSGVNRDEGTLFTVNAAVDSRADFENLVRESVPPEHVEETLALYPAWQYPLPKSALAAFIGDLGFTCNARLQARLVAATQPKTFLYQFTRENFAGLVSGLGVFHASELPYVFHNFRFPFVADIADLVLSDAMIAAWTRFAETGDPGRVGAVAWPAVTPASDYLQIDVLPAPGSGLRSGVCDAVEQWLVP